MHGLAKMGCMIINFSNYVAKRQSFKYDREQSSTFKATEDYMFLEYPQGANVSGPMSVDTVTVSDQQCSMCIIVSLP